MQDREVGKRIRQIRRKLGLTQLEFARRLGVTKGSVARYETGSIPRLRVLYEVAKLGGATGAWVLHGISGTDRKMPLLGPLELNLTKPLAGLLGFLERKAPALANLPQPHRRRYEKRVSELISRIKRELDEYQTVLEMELTREGRRRVRRPNG
jgi:transcriptional regulator with XRE-family HTH domain